MRRKIIVLYKNVKHDFKSLEKLDGDIEFIFTKKALEGMTLEKCKMVLEERLDKVDTENDLIVFNGPSYMSALAGYVWFTQENRSCWNMVAYNTKTHEFEHRSKGEITNELQ